MHAYFDLQRHLVPEARGREEADSLFKQGQAAAVMSGPWLWPLAPGRPDVSPELTGKIGVAVPLDRAFIGFSYLVVWKQCRRVDLAMKLVRGLTGMDFMAAYASRTGPLSVRLDALEHSPLADEPNYQRMVLALKGGRTFPQIPLWGMIEDRLALALDRIWEEVLNEPKPDIEAIMDRQLAPLVKRLEMTLSGG